MAALRSDGGSRWGISARSAFAAATVVLVTVLLGGAGLVAVLRETLLVGIDSAAAGRAAAVAAQVGARGPAGVDDALFDTDQRIVAVQVLADGVVVRRSAAAPDAPLLPPADLADTADGVGARERAERSSPFGAIRVSSLAVDGPGGRRLVLVGEGSAAIDATVGAVIAALAVAAPIVVAASAAATFWLVRRSMRSVDEIRSRVADISASDLSGRVPVPEGRDEIAKLAITMNEMLARIEAGQAAQQRFVGDASHELRNPLATIVSALEVAAVHPDVLTGDLVAGTLLPEALRMKALIDDLLLLARADERGLEVASAEVDLDDVAAAEIARWRAAAGPAPGVEIAPQLRPARVRGDAEALARVLRNLLGNAARHASSVVRVQVDAADGWARVAVADDGPGIAPGDRARVFDRFVRLDTDRSRRAGGTGLGLSIVAEIVAAHGGRVAVGETPGGGATLSVQLPLEDLVASDEPGPESDSDPE